LLGVPLSAASGVRFAVSGCSPVRRGVRAVCDHPGTILGRRDFVVIVRRWQQQDPIRPPGVWTPVGVVDDLELAAAMADLVREDEAGTDASVVSANELLYAFPSEDRARILDRLNSRTTNDLQRELTLRRAAEARLAKHERRSSLDRRSGRDRRSGIDRKPPGGQRRSGHDRRSGSDRRAKTVA
jgi:hypothetical protein